MDTTPDALFVREALKHGRTMWERMNSILDIAEPLLGVDRSKGEKGYIRKQGDGWLFITRDPADTINGPILGPVPLRGRPRYTWLDGPDGIRRGYLKTETRTI